MVTVTIKFCKFKHAYMNTSCIQVFKRNYLSNTVEEKAEKTIHPFKQIHPWKSVKEFADDLLNNIIYNKDGLLVLNKPYGIPRGNGNNEFNKTNYVSNSVHYTLEDALPYICSQLKYPQLTISKCPEKYMSGITLLATDAKVLHAIELAYTRSYFFGNTYWVVTVGVPSVPSHSYRLALKLISNPQYKHHKTILTSKWSINEEKYRKIKIFKARYEIISNSTLNLCSLLKLRASTESRHAIRLFASTFLYTPILGDNIFSSQIQKVGDTYVNIDPFLSVPALQKLDKRLLQLLGLYSNQQEIIPVHIHLKSTLLPLFFGEDILLEAPLPPFFNWTCKQLEFKHLMQNNVPSEQSI
ncbi:Pseudouridylate synthase RPUSD4, mitochondrial [Anthophora quadrimaculata]